MRFKIEKNESKEAERLIEYLCSKNIKVNMFEIEEKSMSGRVVTSLIVEILVPTDE